MKPQKASRKTHTRGTVLLELAGHAAMGAAMGLAFCFIIRLTGQQALLDLIAHNPEPKATAILLVSVVSLFFAVGATLTGMMLMSLDET